MIWSSRIHQSHSITRSPILMFVDEVDIHVDGGQRRTRLPGVPPREVRAARRTERRRRRSRRLGLHRRQPAHQHPHQLPLSPRVRAPSAATARPGLELHRAERRAISSCAVPDRHAGLREDRRPGRAAAVCSPISRRKASASWSRSGGRGGMGNARFATSDQPRAAQGPAGRAGRRQGSAARAEAARRRRPGRLPERRQVDAHRAHLRGAAEDRRLPVHDADAEPGRRAV